MNTFFTHLLIGGFALLCFIIGCGDAEDPLHSINLTGKASGTLATEKMPLTTVPAAPTAPGVGIPFVKEVGYYSDWKLTKPITTAIRPGATFFTKVVFSEPMRFKPADDKSARPILYYRLNGKLIRFRIAKHGAGGKNFVSGDAKPFGGGTDDYVCKYTVPGDVTGEFGAAVGKFNADKDGNTLAKFYTHQKQVTLGVDTVSPEVKEVRYYSDLTLAQPLSGTVKPGTPVFTKVVFSKPMRFKPADDAAARPIVYYRLNGKQVRYRVSEHGASGQDFASGDAKPLGDGTDAYLCKYIVPADGEGEFGVAVGKFSADRAGNMLAAFYTHSKTLKLGVSVAPPPVTEVPQAQTPAPTVLSVKHYLDDNETEEINADEVFVWAGTTLNTKIVFSKPVTPAVTYTTGDRTRAYTISTDLRGVHWRGVCKPTDKRHTVWLCKQSVSVPSFLVTVTTDTEDMAGTHIKESVQTVPIEIRRRPRTEPEPAAIPEPVLPTEPTDTDSTERSGQKDFTGFVYTPKPVRQSIRSEAVPLSGATITIKSGSQSGKSAVTDHAGRYIFKNIEKDELHVRVEKVDFESKEAIVHRSLPTTLSNGTIPNFHGDPQKIPGNILVGQAWPDEVRFILRQTLTVYDLLYVNGKFPPANEDIGGFYTTGVVVVFADHVRRHNGHVGVINVVAHEIAHAHQHTWDAIDGSVQTDFGWTNSPEGKAFAEARRRDLVEVGKTPYDTIPYFDNSLHENAAETCASYWGVGKWGINLKISAPNRFKWAQQWLR